MNLALIGLLGGACFACAAVPSAFACVRAGRNVGVPLTMAWLVFSGTVLVFAYLALKFFTVSGIDWVLSFNYWVEAFSWGIILFYTYRPRGAK